MARVFAFTVAIEGVGAVLLTAAFARRLPFPEARYHGVFHSVSAFCNAGFELYVSSFMEYRGDWALNLTAMALITSGGLGFGMLQDLVDRWRA